MAAAAPTAVRQPAGLSVFPPCPNPVGPQGSPVVPNVLGGSGAHIVNHLAVIVCNRTRLERLARLGRLRRRCRRGRGVEAMWAGGAAARVDGCAAAHCLPGCSNTPQNAGRGSWCAQGPPHAASLRAALTLLSCAPGAFFALTFFGFCAAGSDIAARCCCGRSLLPGLAI